MTMSAVTAPAAVIDLPHCQPSPTDCFPTSLHGPTITLSSRPAAVWNSRPRPSGMRTHQAGRFGTGDPDLLNAGDAELGLAVAHRRPRQAAVVCPGFALQDEVLVLVPQRGKLTCVGRVRRRDPVENFELPRHRNPMISVITASALNAGKGDPFARSPSGVASGAAHRRQASALLDCLHSNDMSDQLSYPWPIRRSSNRVREHRHHPGRCWPSCRPGRSPRAGPDQRSRGGPGLNARKTRRGGPLTLRLRRSPTYLCPRTEPTHNPTLKFSTDLRLDE